MTRPVTIFKWIQSDETKFDSHWNKIEDGQGIFHKFGVDFTVGETGPGMFTTAIVEMADGEIRNLEVSLVRFDDVDREDKSVEETTEVLEDQDHLLNDLMGAPIAALDKLTIRSIRGKS